MFTLQTLIQSISVNAKTPKSCLQTLRAFRICGFSVLKTVFYTFLNLPSIEDTNTAPVRYDSNMWTCYEETAFWWISSTGLLDVLSYGCPAETETGMRVKYKSIVPGSRIGEGGGGYLQRRSWRVITLEFLSTRPQKTPDSPRILEGIQNSSRMRQRSIVFSSLATSSIR